MKKRLRLGLTRRFTHGASPADVGDRLARHETRGTNRGSERQRVSHPASGCLRGKDQIQEGRDPHGTDPHRGRPHRGRPIHRGSDPHKGRDPHRRHTVRRDSIGIVVNVRLCFKGGHIFLRCSKIDMGTANFVNAVRIFTLEPRNMSFCNRVNPNMLFCNRYRSNLAFTRYSFTSRRLCTNQSSFHPPRPPA